EDEYEFEVEGEGEDEAEDAEDAVGRKPRTVAGPGRARPSMPNPNDVDSGGDLDLVLLSEPPTDSDDAGDDVAEAHDEYKKKRRQEPELPAIDPNKRRKTLIQLGVAGGVAVVIVLAGIFLFSGDSKPLPPPPPPRDDTTVKAPVPDPHP